MTDDSWTPFLRRVVLIANRKGGVAKSAIVRSVAEEAARSGYRVCVVDGDPQGNVSKIDFNLENDRGRGLAMAMQYGDTNLKPVQVRGVDVISGGPDLQGVIGAALAAGGHLDLASNLRTSLGRLCEQQRYDLVLIDSGPGETLLLDTYMRAARWLVVPTSSDDAALDGVDMIGSRYVQTVRSGHQIDLLGAVLTLVDPRATARNAAILSDIAGLLGEAAAPFETTIRFAPSNIIDARRNGLSARGVAEGSRQHKKELLASLRRKEKPEKRGSENTWWSGSSGAALAQDYEDLTREILTRIAEREKGA